MKKSLLNITITMALSAAVFSGSVLSTQAYANEQIADDLSITDNNNSNDNTTETYMYPGMGVGAASGTVIAGPVGFLVGGLIGAIVGANYPDTGGEVTSASEAKPSLAENSVEDKSLANDSIEQSSHQHDIQVAQLDAVYSIVDNSIESQPDRLMDILTADLSLDIYFRTGSTAIESFYPARLSAIADLMNTMEKLELHLDGYTDRRGNKANNIALANQRIEKVRDQLIDAGVDENRIISKAFGEMKMVSSAGDLEGYTFDRKVVIRFERTTADSLSSMATALADFSTEDTGISMNEENLLPVVAETPVIVETKARF